MHISVFLRADNLVARERVRTVLDLEGDLDFAGRPAESDSLAAGAVPTNLNVIVTDILLPHDFSREGIATGKLVFRLVAGRGVGS